MNESNLVPAGFFPMELVSGFNQQFGQLYLKDESSCPVLGFRVDARHLNPLGTLHGGAIATFADFQISPVFRFADPDDVSDPSTISLTVDYFAPGKLGDWVELHVRFQKRTGSMVFTNGEIKVGNDLIARTAGIFKILSRRT